MWNIKNRIAKMFRSDQNDPTRQAATHYEPAVELNHDAIYADAVHLYLDQQLPYSSNLTRLRKLKRFLKKNVNPFLKTGAKPYPNITRRSRLWKKNEFKVEIFGMTYERTPSEVKLHILLNSNSRAAPIIKGEAKDPDELQTNYGSNWIGDRHEPHSDAVESQTRRRPTLNASQPLEVVLEDPHLPPAFQVETLSWTQSGQLAPQPPARAAIPPDDLPAQPPVPAAGPPFLPVEPPVPPVQPLLRPLEPPLPPLEPTLPPLESPAPPLEPPLPPLEPPARPLEPPARPLEPPARPLEPPTSPLESPAPSFEAPAPPLEPPLSPLESPAPSLEMPAPPIAPPAPPAQPVVSNQGTSPPNGAASAPRSSQRPSVVQSTGAACERIYSTDAIKMVNVGARWCKTHAHKQMSNDDGNAWVRSAWLAAFSQLDPETLEATLTAKMTGRALEDDIHAVVELVTLIEQKGVSAVESSDFEAAFEAAHGSMANLTFELINARDKAKYRVDKQGLASTSDDGTAPLEERRELYRERKAQRSSLFAALNNPENTGSSQHIAKLMEELGVDAVIAEIKNSDDDRFVIHAQPGSGLADLTMTREPKFNAFELSRALTHKPVITMESSGWGVQVPHVPRKSRTCLPANSVNRTPALAPSYPPAFETEQVQSVQQAQTISRNTANAPPDSNQNTFEPLTPAVEDQAASNSTDETHPVDVPQSTRLEQVANASSISDVLRTQEVIHASTSGTALPASISLPIHSYGIDSIDFREMGKRLHAPAHWHKKMSPASGDPGLQAAWTSVILQHFENPGRLEAILNEKMGRGNEEDAKNVRLLVETARDTGPHTMFVDFSAANEDRGFSTPGMLATTLQTRSGLVILNQEFFSNLTTRIRENPALPRQAVEELPQGAGSASNVQILAFIHLLGGDAVLLNRPEAAAHEDRRFTLDVLTQANSPIAHRRLGQDSTQRTAQLMDNADAGIPVLARTGDQVDVFFPHVSMRAITQEYDRCVDENRAFTSGPSTGPAMQSQFQTSYGEKKISMSMLRKAALEEIHELVNMSSEFYNCWLRAAWFSIFTQCDPATIGNQLRTALGPRLQMSLHQLEQEAAIHEISNDDVPRFESSRARRARLTAEVETRRSLATRVGGYNPDGSHKLEKSIEVIEEIARSMKTERGLREKIRYLGDTPEFKMEASEEGHLQDITYSILKKIRLERPTPVSVSNLTTSIFNRKFGDHVQIATLLGALGLDSMVLKVSWDPSLYDLDPEFLHTCTNFRMPAFEEMPSSLNRNILEETKRLRGNLLRPALVGRPLAVHQGGHYQVYRPRSSPLAF